MFLEALLGLGMSAVTALWAPMGTNWSCGNQKWISAPQYQGNLLSGTQAGRCQIFPQKGGSFDEIEAYIIHKITTEGQVNYGPVAETFLNMPSKFYNINQTVGSGSMIVVAEMLVHVATDKSTQVAFVSNSRHVDGTGDGKYLKRIDLEVIVTPFEDTRSIDFSAPKLAFQLDFKNTVSVEKPWFAPKDLFKDKVSQGMTQIFTDQRNSLTNDLAGRL
ncbi:hypothetical protein K2X30_00035 [bacterium]|jgi:hypothetical protein|nr:hypothetical protein [bacterium]